MKRLVKLNKDKNLDVREPIILTTPSYRTFGEQNEFTKSDEKSYQRMMNEPVIERIEKEKGERESHMSNKSSRLKKIALMPTEMFKSQLDQISDKGRDVLKAIEEYKFFVEQTSRVMKNDPTLTEVIIGKKKNLEEASTKIYDVVFDIENLDINALYEKQQQEIQNQQNNPAGPNITDNAPNTNDLKLPDGPQTEESNGENKPNQAPSTPSVPPSPPAADESTEPASDVEDDDLDFLDEEPDGEEKSEDSEQKPSKSRLKQKPEDEGKDNKEPKKDTNKDKGKPDKDKSDKKDVSKDKKN